MQQFEHLPEQSGDMAGPGIPVQLRDRPQYDFMFHSVKL